MMISKFLQVCQVSAALALLAAPAVKAADAGCAPELADRAWSKCTACHSVDKDEAGKLGPNLHGLFSRKAGSLPGFVYSPAMSQAGFEWTPAQLDTFLANPQKAVPNNRMPFGGLPNAKERAALVCKLHQTTK